MIETFVKAVAMDISKKLDLRPFLYGRDPQLLWHFDAVEFDTPELVAVLDVDLKLTKDTTGFVVKGKLSGKGKVPCKDCYATLWSDFEGDVLEHYVLESIGKEKDKAHQVELLEEDFYEVVNPLHPFDLWDGCNFRLRIRKVEGYRNYEKSDFAAQAPLLEDDDEMKVVWESEHALQPIIAPDIWKAH
jgi:hypothetical protein